MLSNYPIKQKNQHQPPELDYKDYINTSGDDLGVNFSNESMSDIEIEMSNSLFDMRREFKRNVKKIRNFYSNKEPKVSSYKFQNAKSRRGSIGKIHLAKRHAAG